MMRPRPWRKCLELDCPELTQAQRCPQHATAHYSHDAKVWYNSAAWKRLRLNLIAEQPFCADCRTQLTEEVHHDQAHRGDHARFFEPGNLIGLCKRCHSRRTAAGE